MLKKDFQTYKTSAKKKSFFTFSMLLTCLSVCVLLCIHLYISFIPTSTYTSSHILTIPAKSTVHNIAIKLKEKRLIHSVNHFKLMTKLFNKEHQFKAGYFKLPKKINQHHLIVLLTTHQGNHNLVKITIPEGFSIEQIAKTLEEKSICNAKDFEIFCHTNAKETFKKTFPFLQNIPLTTIEGYLFPETYFFKPQESIYIVTKKMLSEFNKQLFLPYQKNQPSNSSYSFQDLLSLASIIQKESRIESEMTTISSVYHNRLKKNMRLQADPTVVYALGKSYKDRVYYKDLEVKSPYNTYRVKGLPPTPIASPGKKAFNAALNPKDTPYLFFVAKPDGRHHFTKTYKEHTAYQRLNR